MGSDWGKKKRRGIILDMNLSFFAKPAFLNVNPSEPFKDRTKPVKSGHLQRVSSMIRGDQIAEYLGVKLNPESGYQEDCCIYVKPMVRKGEDFKFGGKINYVDIVDGHNLGQLLEKYPNVGCIVCSRADFETMSKVIKNRIIVIPQFHCNFERIHRTRTEVTTVGVIGVTGAFAYLPEGLKEELAKRGMNLIEYSKFFTRQDIVDFYQRIDVQIVWRPYKKLLSNPLKIVNAMSFGVPTIALDELAFREVGGCYDPVHTLEEFLDRLDVIRLDPAVYADYSVMCLAGAEKYHINNIAKLYKNLCTI